jgi:hypothetical protein
MRSRPQKQIEQEIEDEDEDIAVDVKNDAPSISASKKNTMLIIKWCVQDAIYKELLYENTIVNAISYHTQPEKLESEVVKQGLFGGKMYFQHDKAKSHGSSHFSKIVTFTFPNHKNHCI